MEGDNMPIQVLQRENTTDQSFQSYADRVQKQQQMDQDYSIKLASLKQLEMDFKLKSKMAESEMSKREFDTKAAQTANYFAMLNWARQHYEDPEQRMKAVSTITGNHGKESYGDLFKSPEFSTMVKNMSLSPEERQQSGAGAKSMAEANVLSQIRIPGMEGGPQAPDSPMSPQDVNAPRAGAVGGNVPGGGPVLTGANIGGFNIGFPEGAGAMAGAETRARESGKPYNLEEGKVVASQGTIKSAITELGKLVDKGAVDGIMAQSAVDMGNPVLTSYMNSDTRNALNYMNHLKNLIPFARGGKQLTPYEAKLVFRLVNTQGKTRAQVKRDLAVYEREFDTMVKLISTARGDINLEDLNMNFGGGKTYEELAGGQGGGKSASPFTIRLKE